MTTCNAPAKSLDHIIWCSYHEARLRNNVCHPVPDRIVPNTPVIITVYSQGGLYGLTVWIEEAVSFILLLRLYGKYCWRMDGFGNEAAVVECPFWHRSYCNRIYITKTLSPYVYLYSKILILHRALDISYPNLSNFCHVYQSIVSEHCLICCRCRSSKASPTVRKTLIPVQHSYLRYCRSTTLVARDDPKPSAYPYGDAATNEFKWLNWDPKNDADKRDGRIIHQAFIEWKDLVKQGAVAAAKKDGDTFKRWFGKQEEPEDIKNVFGNMWDGSGASKPVADMVCDRKDFDDRCKGKVAAYTLPDTGVFHVCQYGLDLPQLSKIQCGDLKDSCSTNMRSLSMTLLHEMT